MFIRDVVIVALFIAPILRGLESKNIQKSDKELLTLRPIDLGILTQRLWMVLFIALNPNHH